MDLLSPKVFSELLIYQIHKTFHLKCHFNFPVLISPDKYLNWIFAPYLSMRSTLLWTSIMEFMSLSGICRFLRTFRTFTFWFIVSGWLMSLTWTNWSWRTRRALSQKLHPEGKTWPSHLRYTPSVWCPPGWQRRSLWAGAAAETGSQWCPRTGQSCDWATGLRERWHPGWRRAGSSAEGRCHRSGPWWESFFLRGEKQESRSVKLKLWTLPCTSPAPLTAVCVSQHGHDGQLLVFALGSQQVPLPPQLFQRRANLHLSLLQQPLLDFIQSLTCEEQPLSWRLFNHRPGRQTLPTVTQVSKCYLNLRCTSSPRPAGPGLWIRFSDEICQKNKNIFLNPWR